MVILVTLEAVYQVFQDTLEQLEHQAILDIAAILVRLV